MNKIRLSLALLFSSAALFWVASLAWASEGTAELVSTTGASTRCFVSSVMMRDLNHKLLVSCRDLIYPADSNLFTYVLWANPIEDRGPAKLGELGFGKAEFNIKPAFSSLFVTKEAGGRVGSPSENVVMRGNVRPISFLEGPPPSAPPAEEVPEEEKAEEEAPAPRRNILTTVLLLIFIVSFIIVGVGGLIFFLIRARE